MHSSTHPPAPATSMKARTDMKARNDKTRRSFTHPTLSTGQHLWCITLSFANHPSCPPHNPIQFMTSRRHPGRQAPDKTRHGHAAAKLSHCSTRPASPNRPLHTPLHTNTKYIGGQTPPSHPLPAAKSLLVHICVGVVVGREGLPQRVVGLDGPAPHTQGGGGQRQGGGVQWGHRVGAVSQTNRHACIADDGTEIAALDVTHPTGANTPGVLPLDVIEHHT
mmetsp:Transcript_25167/g.62325  ORF Transcript_25167/g.62325 Transcript_25167/m.62325 type:complete len:221 (-) Transcript_25167:1648-2310(-)